MFRKGATAAQYSLRDLLAGRARPIVSTVGPDGVVVRERAAKPLMSSTAWGQHLKLRFWRARGSPRARS